MNLRPRIPRSIAVGTADLRKGYPSGRSPVGDPPDIARSSGLVDGYGQVTISRANIGIMKDRVLSASDFKATCLSCLGEVEQSGESITITRRGRPVAVLSPAARTAGKSPRNSWARKARVVGDIVDADTSALWGAAEPR
jgi:prevent-host-death family protein